MKGFYPQKRTERESFLTKDCVSQDHLPLGEGHADDFISTDQVISE